MEVRIKVLVDGNQWFEFVREEGTWVSADTGDFVDERFAMRLDDLWQVLDS